jgi:hypothetical protein
MLSVMAGDKASKLKLYDTVILMLKWLELKLLIRSTATVNRREQRHESFNVSEVCFNTWTVHISTQHILAFINNNLFFSRSIFCVFNQSSTLYACTKHYNLCFLIWILLQSE